MNVHGNENKVMSGTETKKKKATNGDESTIYIITLQVNSGPFAWLQPNNKRSRWREP